MPSWFTELKPTAGSIIAAVVIGTGGITVGVSLDGWIGVPGTMRLFGDSLSITSTVVAQNRRSIIQLRDMDAEILATLEIIEETVRTIDRRTCIASAETESERQECAIR